MREIKFRGKAINGKWVYGNLLKLAGGYLIIPIFNEVNEVPDNSTPAPLMFYENEFYAIYSNTIGQFTGLYDKNGEEIYEGDIVKWTDEKDRMDKFLLCYVDWHKHLCKFYLSFGEEQKVNDSRTDIFEMMRMGYKYEVIGNIHDNPELLKGKEK